MKSEFTEMQQQKFYSEQQENPPTPATYRDLLTLQEVMMRKNSTTYQPPKKVRKAA